LIGHDSRTGLDNAERRLSHGCVCVMRCSEQASHNHAREESYQLARCMLQEMLSMIMAMSKAHTVIP
jgi:hypothetical protein